MSELHKFETGAVRSTDSDDFAYELISPIGLRRLAATCQEGASKYSPYNWEAGMPVANLLRHAIDHIYKYLGGDRSEDHLSHAGWGLFGAMHSEEMWPELNFGTLRTKGCKAPVPDSVLAGLAEAASSLMGSYSRIEGPGWDLAKSLARRPTCSTCGCWTEECACPDWEQKPPGFPAPPSDQYPAIPRPGLPIGCEWCENEICSCRKDSSERPYPGICKRCGHYSQDCDCTIDRDDEIPACEVCGYSDGCECYMSGRDV